MATPYGFKWRLLVFAMISVIGVSCGGSSENVSPSNDLPDWLLGKWVVEGNAEMHEDWSQTRDSIFTGFGYYMANGDSTVFEYLTIQQYKDSICYFAHVPGQNEGRKIPFKFTANSDTGFVCENPDHDFPRKIHYKPLATDTIAVSLSGVQDEKPKSMKLRFIRE